MLIRSRALLAILAVCLPLAVDIVATSAASAAAGARAPAGWFHPLDQQVALDATVGTAAKPITMAGRFGMPSSVRAVEVL